MQNRGGLIFVYNADASLFAQVTDFAHKLLRPKTYECNLCKLTYGSVKMKKDWQEFLQTLPYEVEFLHRDEFQEKYPAKAKTSLPAVFLKENNDLKILLGAEQIDQAESIFDLKTLLLHALPFTKL